MSRAVLQRRRLLRFAAAGVGLLVLGPGARHALAHRTHVTLTRVASNPRSGVWEIVHAVHYHDALRLLAARGVADDVQPASVAGRARLALEVERGFRWRAPDGSELRPVTIGAELDGDNVLVYQELQVPSGTAGRYQVEASLLQDVFPDQVNTISVEFERPFVVLRLSRGYSRGEFSVRAK